MTSGPMDPSDTTWKYHGMDESLQYLEQYMQQHGPFDGLMGFSQGASVAGLAALLQHRGTKFQVGGTEGGDEGNVRRPERKRLHRGQPSGTYLLW